VLFSVHGSNQAPDQIKTKMNASILTSDRYIAIKSAHGLTFNKTLRILCKVAGVETIIPARWNAANARLESVAIDNPGVAIPMYQASRKLEAKLKAAGYSFELLNETKASALTS
jgi:hypothetical protein